MSLFAAFRKTPAPEPRSLQSRPAATSTAQVIEAESVVVSESLPTLGHEAKESSLGAMETGKGLSLLPTQNRQSIITNLAEFPRREEVLTGVNASTPGLRVPMTLQDYVMVVRVDARRAVLVYDPSYMAQVKQYFATLRSAVTATGLLQMDQDAIFATAAVIKDVRLAAEAKQAKSGVSSGATSNGSNLFREWATIANSARATDLHIGIIDGGRAQVLMRVDGSLEPIDESSRGIFTDRDALNAMQAAFGNMADSKSNSAGVFKEDESMSCMIGSRLGIPNIRLRFSSEPGFYGPKAVSRILHSDLSIQPMSFTDMGLAQSQIDLIDRAQRLQSGAIIVIGVTGSGKTTFQKTFIETHPLNGIGCLYGIADPIEYLLKGVHQRYIQRDIMTLSTKGVKDPYSAAIEQFMRMDPNLIDVGEARDRISARALATVANTGHISMGTLHAPNIGGAITRLIDPQMGLTRHELTGGNMLGFLSYKALIPVLCKCAFDQTGAHQWHKAHKEEREAAYIGSLLTQLKNKYSLDPAVFRFKNPEGCPLCRGRGTKGLTMVAEMLMPDDEWRTIAAKGDDRAAIRYWRETSDKRMDSPNMDGKLVAEHTIYKAILGRVDPRNIETFGPLNQLEVIK